MKTSNAQIQSQRVGDGVSPIPECVGITLRSSKLKAQASKGVAECGVKARGLDRARKSDCFAVN